MAATVGLGSAFAFDFALAGDMVRPLLLDVGST